jgi:transposase
MIQRQLKLKLTKKQEATLEEWLPILTSIWNWAIRKIELDAKDHIYYTHLTFKGMLPGTSKIVGVPGHTIKGILDLAYLSWARCFKKLAKKPKFKGNRNKLNTIPFPDVIKPPQNNRVKIPGLGMVRYHKQNLPDGKIKCGRVVKRASGWYLCLMIDAAPNKIPAHNDGIVGIDPGYNHLLTLSTGEKIPHPKEWVKKHKRLAQAQRSNNKHLAARIKERIANQKKDRNHKLSRYLVSMNATIVWSKDNLASLRKTGFGASVEQASHGQLSRMLSYKCRAGGREYIEVPGKNSTRVCSTCGADTGPHGRAGLKVRQWVCPVCGTHHDRDINAAINILIAGVGTAHERKVAYERIPSEISSGRDVQQ